VHFSGSKARSITDPYGQITTITYDGSGLRTQITEPGGRYLKLIYDPNVTDPDGTRLLTRVEAHGLGSPAVTDWVNYAYLNYSPGVVGRQPKKMLRRVDYSDGTSAYYDYRSDNVPENQTSMKLYPLLQRCDDTRYAGAMNTIWYEYLNSAAHGVIVNEKNPGIGAISSISGTPGFGVTFTETRIDTWTRSFTYTSISRCHGIECTICDDEGPAGHQQMLLSYTDFNNNRTQLGYDTNWFVNSVTDENTHTTNYTRGTAIGEIRQVRHPGDNSTIDYGYGPDPHYVTSVTDERGKLTTYVRDANHRVTRINYPSDAATPVAWETFTYSNDLGQVLTHRFKNGAWERFAYSPRGLLTDKWYPKQGSVPTDADPHIHYTYYGTVAWADRMNTEIMPVNWCGFQASETYEYDRSASPANVPIAGRGLITKITHADAKYKSFRYDQFGRKVSEWDELGRRTSYAYDAYNRVISVAKMPNAPTTFDYSPAQGDGARSYWHTTNSTYWQVSPVGVVTRSLFDKNFRKTSSTVGGSTTWFHYDPVGNQDYVTDPRGSGPGDSLYTTYTDYDARNRKYRTRQPLNQTTTLTLDAASNIRSIQRPDNTIASKTYDAVNRVLNDTVPKSATENLTTVYTYNPSGTVASIRDPRVKTTTFAYNASDQKTEMDYHDGSSRSWAYDNVLNLKSRTTPNGEVQYFGYDNRNRKYGEFWDTFPATHEWRYFGLDGANNLRRGLNGTGAWNTHYVADIHRNYDATDHCILDRQGITGYPVVDVNYAYDAEGKKTQLQIDASYDYTFSYDSMGRPEKIIETGSGFAAYQYHYDAASNETQRDNRRSGVTQATPRDSLNRISSVTLSNSGVLSEGYGYDQMNRVNSITRGAASDAFGYFWDGELKSAQYAYRAQQINYTLDNGGNRTNVTDNVNGNKAYTPNNVNQYTVVGPDAVVNGPDHAISSYQGISYTYEQDERLRSATSGANVYTLSYDALGRCVKRDLNGDSTHYIYDGERPIQEFGNLNHLVGRNVYGKGIDEILDRRAYAADNTWNWYFFQNDREGSIIALTDNAGTILERYRYDAFGAPLVFGGPPSWSARPATIYDNRFLFTGREYAASYHSTNTPFKFYEYRARAYNPALGRFTSEDPKLFDAGDLNLFRYCRNDPLDLTDPLGLISPGLEAALETTVPGLYEWDQAVANYHAGNYGTAVSWGIVSVGSGTLGVATWGRTTQAQAGFRAARLAASERQVTAVLGKFENKPNFQRVAEHLGVKSFNIPQHIYDKMTPAQQWAANQKMLDRAIARGGDFLFDKPIKDISSTSGGLRKELDYLSDKGFKLSPDGWSMTKSESLVLKATEEADNHSRHFPMPEPR
jgi:RHS repeat-associated protein